MYYCIKENNQVCIEIVFFISGRMFNTNECLKIKLNKINNKLEQISFEEHNELKHSVREHVMWIEDCWTCLHCLYPFLLSYLVYNHRRKCNCWILFII